MASDAGAHVRALGFPAHQRGRAFALAGPSARNAVRHLRSASRSEARSSDLIRGPKQMVFPKMWSTDMDHESDQANRAISTGKLNALPRLHTQPINVVVFHGSQGSTRFEVGFPLRCIQRLSRPYIATLHCGWRHNSSTRGTSIPVLSY